MFPYALQVQIGHLCTDDRPLGDPSPLHGGRMQQTRPDTILTREEVAGWLKVRPRQVERLRIPHLDLGRKTKRYLTEDVPAWLQAKRAEAGRS